MRHNNSSQKVLIILDSDDSDFTPSNSLSNKNFILESGESDPHTKIIHGKEGYLNRPKAKVRSKFPKKTEINPNSTPIKNGSSISNSITDSDSNSNSNSNHSNKKKIATYRKILPKPSSIILENINEGNDLINLETNSIESSPFRKNYQSNKKEFSQNQNLLSRSNSSSPIPEFGNKSHTPNTPLKRPNISKSRERILNSNISNTSESESSDDAFFSRGLSKEQRKKIIGDISYSTNSNSNHLGMDLDTSGDDLEKKTSLFLVDNQRLADNTNPDRLNDVPSMHNGSSIQSQKSIDFSSDTSIESIDIDSKSFRFPKTTIRKAQKISDYKNPGIQMEIDAQYADLDSSLLQVLNSVNSRATGSELEPKSSSRSKATYGDRELDTKESVVEMMLILKLDPIFIEKELSLFSSFFWNSFNLSCNNIDHDKPISAVFSKIGSDEMFIDVLTKLSKEKKIPSDISDFVLVFEGVKVYPTVTPKAIASSGGISFDFYPHSVYERFIEQQRKDTELPLIPNTPNSLENSNSEYNNETLKGIVEDNIKIKIRDKSGNDQFIDVGKNVKISDIIIQYKKMRGLPSSVAVKFSFDDETLSPQTQIKDTEIEDEDMIAAIY
ncbi:hypothetical protein AYI68_g8316 [Smittium mucronatum]|uniref:Rad60/SUMO-like domain-containing protein n=1 Tax=Smittium mucronatum TaxID=133383 RepID=A0A1R0GL95_9FUNG|nr:hypothetical protein AYI68_g8316 [Smittium mucronatum]